MAYQTPEPRATGANPNSEDQDQLPPLPEGITTPGSEDVAGEVRFAKGTQPWWMKNWPYVLVAWALWFAFVGGTGLFHVEQPINLFFSGVVIAWTIYHVLATRFNWPNFPLG